MKTGIHYFGQIARSVIKNNTIMPLSFAGTILLSSNNALNYTDRIIVYFDIISTKGTMEIKLELRRNYKYHNE